MVFPGAGRGNDEAALAAADGGHDIDDAGGEALGRGFEADPAGRVDRLELVEMRELGGLLGRHVVDPGDLDELRAARAFLVESVDPLAEAQVVFADGFRGDKDVVAGLFEIFAGDAEEAEAFGGEFEQSVGLDFRAGEQDRAAVFGVVAAALVAAAVVALAAVLVLLAVAAGLIDRVPVSAPFAFVAAAFAAAFGGLALAVARRALALRFGARCWKFCGWPPWGGRSRSS